VIVRKVDKMMGSKIAIQCMFLLVLCAISGLFFFSFRFSDESWNNCCSYQQSTLLSALCSAFVEHTTLSIQFDDEWRGFQFNDNSCCYPHHVVTIFCPNWYSLDHIFCPLRRHYTLMNRTVYNIVFCRNFSSEVCWKIKIFIFNIFHTTML